MNCGAFGLIKRILKYGVAQAVEEVLQTFTVNAYFYLTAKIFQKKCSLNC